MAAAWLAMYGIGYGCIITESLLQLALSGSMTFYACVLDIAWVCAGCILIRLSAILAYRGTLFTLPHQQQP